MEIKFFSDIFDALKKTIKAIADLPIEMRDELRQTPDDTFNLPDNPPFLAQASVPVKGINNKNIKPINKVIVQNIIPLINADATSK